MPISPEDKKVRNYEANKKYREAHKEKYKIYMKNYFDRNREELTDYQKQYHKEYNKTEACKKKYTIGRWKKRGVITDDFDALYETYINTWNCENCDIELIAGNTGANKRCLDHCHKTGIFRNILCTTCNNQSILRIMKNTVNLNI